MGGACSAIIVLGIGPRDPPCTVTLKDLKLSLTVITLRSVPARYLPPRDAGLHTASGTAHYERGVYRGEPRLPGVHHRGRGLARHEVPPEEPGHGAAVTSFLYNFIKCFIRDYPYKVEPPAGKRLYSQWLEEPIVVRLALALPLPVQIDQHGGASQL